MDKFDAFLDELIAHYPGAVVQMNGPATTDTADLVEVKEAVAHGTLGAPGKLDSISIRLVLNRGTSGKDEADTEFQALQIFMHNTLITSGAIAAIKISGPRVGTDQQGYRRAVPQILESHTVRLTRRQRKTATPLIRPVRTADAIQQEREEQLTIRAGRRAGLWGVLAGFAGGLGGGLVAQWLGG